MDSHEFAGANGVIVNWNSFALFITALAIPLFTSAAVTPSALEAQHCLECSRLETEFPQQVSALQSVANVPSEKQCDMKTLLVDPKQKSILQDLGMSYEGSDPMAIVGRSSLTCLYGALEGGAESLRDLVLMIPQLLGLTYDALKSAGSAVANANYSEWLNKLRPQNVFENGKKAFQVSKDSVTSAFQGATNKLYSAYAQGGATGAVAAVAQAAYSSSPHHVVGNFLSSLAVGVGHAIANEWAGFTCMPPEAMTQVVCEVVGYVAADIASGKLLISALRKAPKLTEVVTKIRSRLENKPVIGQWLMRDLKSTELSRCAKIDEKMWMNDSKIKLQMKAIDVTVVGATVLARGIDPATLKPGCFEVAGKLAESIAARIRSTEARAASSAVVAENANASSLSRPAASGESVDIATVARADSEAATPALNAAAETSEFYSARSRQFARTTHNFVADVNERAGVKLSSKQAAAIAERLEAAPEQAQNYGKILESLDQLKLSGEGLLGKEAKKSLANLKEGESLVQSLNSALVKMGRPGKPSKEIDLDLFRKAITEANQTGDSRSIKILNQAVAEFMKESNPKKTIEESIESWEKSLKKKNSSLADDTIEKAKSCMFSSAGSR